ncbi:MAG: hypothetical protein EB107_04675 [Proteobacteria bacterium]|nr:hypothetical protein [Pseudomonadota bacterium]
MRPGRGTQTRYRVTPSLRPGLEPGTVDIDLTVKDKLPLHGSVELSDRMLHFSRRGGLEGIIKLNVCRYMGENSQ